MAMGDTRELHLVLPPDPDPREVAAIAAKLVGYTLDLCEQAGLRTAVMVLRDALEVLEDGDDIDDRPFPSRGDRPREGG